MKKPHSLAFVALVLATLACASISPPIPTPTPTPLSCLDESAEFISQSKSLISQWDDANEIAGRTARIGLASVISNLQEIERQAEGVAVPTCSAPVKDAMISYMNAQLDAYLSFLGMDQDTVVYEKMNKANSYRDEYFRKLSELQPGIEIPVTPTTAVQIIPTPINAASFVEIVPSEMKCTSDSIGNTILSGTVRNTSNTYDLVSVRLRASLVDASGQVISTNSGYIDSDVLFKNSTSTYKVYLYIMSDGTGQCSIAVESALLR